MQNPIFLRLKTPQQTLFSLLSFSFLALFLFSLSSCEDGDLSGLNDESLIATSGLVSISVAVKDPVYPNGNTAPPAIMPLAKTQQFDVTGTTTTGDSVAPSELNPQVVWSVSDANLAKIDTNGLLTSIAAGTVTVTAAFGSLSSTTTSIDVSAATASSIATSIEGVTTTDINMCQNTQLQASANYDDGNGTTFAWGITNEVDWTSADTVTNAVKIDTVTSGLVAYVATPPADGTSPILTTITATSSTIGTSDLILNVLYDAANFTALTIDQAGPVSLPVNDTLQLGATRAPPGSNDAIASITDWQSANPQFVTVDKDTGLVTAVAKGGSTITATCSDKTDTVQIVVSEDKTLDYVRIDLTDANSDDIFELSVGATKNLKATAFYADGTNDTAIAIDPDANWTEIDLSGTNVIDIDNSSSDNKGRIDAKTIGTAQVTLRYTAGDVTKSDRVVVQVK